MSVFIAGYLADIAEHIHTRTHRDTLSIWIQDYSNIVSTNSGSLTSVIVTHPHTNTPSDTHNT